MFRFVFIPISFVFSASLRLCVSVSFSFHLFVASCSSAFFSFYLRPCEFMVTLNLKTLYDSCYFIVSRFAQFNNVSHSIFRPFNLSILFIHIDIFRASARSYVRWFLVVSCNINETKTYSSKMDINKHEHESFEVWCCRSCLFVYLLLILFPSFLLLALSILSSS